MVDSACLREALEAGRRRDYRKAIAILEPLAVGVGADEIDPSVFLYLGRSWHAEGNYSRAIQYLKIYIRLRPDDGGGWFFLGRSYLSAGRYPASIWALKKSIAFNSDSLDALGLLAAAYLKARNSAAALRFFELALTLDPESPHLNQGYRNALFIEAVRVLRRGEPELAAQMFSFLLKNGHEGVSLRLYLGHALRDSGNIEGALPQYRAAGALAPGDTSLIWYAVSCLFSLGRREEADTLISGLDPGETDGLVSRKWTEQMADIRIMREHVTRGKWQNAAELGRLYIKKYGGDAVIHSFMGEAFRNLGKYDPAENHFRKAEQAELAQQHERDSGQGKSGVPGYRYGMLMTLLDRKDWAGLEQELSRRNAAPLDQETMEYYSTVCAANLGRDPAAVLESVQRLFPSHAGDINILYILAAQYLALGLTDIAQNWYRRVITLNGHYEEARLGLIVCLEQEYLEKGRGGRAGNRGRERELEKAYREYLELWPDNTSIRRDYARFLEGLEQWAKAADEAEKIIPWEGQSDALDRQMALRRRRAGQYRVAAILYRGILQRNPRDRHALHCLVFCLDRMGAHTAALHLIVKGNASLSTSAEGFLIEAIMHLRAKKQEKALDVLRTAGTSFPRDWRIPEKIAEIYRRDGIIQLAVQYEQQAEKLKKSGNCKTGKVLQLHT